MFPPVRVLDSIPRHGGNPRFFQGMLDEDLIRRAPCSKRTCEILFFFGFAILVELTGGQSVQANCFQVGLGCEC